MSRGSLLTATPPGGRTNGITTRSAIATIRYSPMPMMQAKTIAAHDRSKFRNAEYVAMY
jgi:hypothetical protein